MEKRCPKCIVSKESEEFYSNKGNNSWCKQCHSEYYKSKSYSKYGKEKQIRHDLENGNRLCNKCKEEKCLEDFSKNKKCKQGRERTCKECVNRSRDSRRKELNEKKRQYYIENRDRIIEKYHKTKVLKDKTFKICVDCKKEKPWDDFIKQRRVCKPCENERQRKYRQQNKEKFKKIYKEYREENRVKILQSQKKWRDNNKGEYQKNWRAENKEKCAEYKHKRRMRKLNNGRNDLTELQIKELKQRIPFCIICGDDEDLVLDHKMPLSKGGENTLSNITILCRSCNSSKGDKYLFDYIDTIWWSEVI